MPRGQDRNKDDDRASAAEIQKALKGMDYPAKKEDLLKHAKGQNAPKDVISVLNRMPEQEYNSAVDVSKALHEAEGRAA